MSPAIPLISIIEKVPRDIPGEKLGKSRQVKDNGFQQFEHMQVQNCTEPGVQKNKRSMLVCHARCKCSFENTWNLAKRGK